MRVCRRYCVYVLLLLVSLLVFCFPRASLTVSASENDTEVSEVDQPVEEDPLEEDPGQEDQLKDGSEGESEAEEDEKPESSDQNVQHNQIVTYIEAESDIEALNYIIQQLSDIDSVDEVMKLYGISIVLGFGLNCTLSFAGMAVGAFSRIFSVVIQNFDGKGV